VLARPAWEPSLIAGCSGRQSVIARAMRLIQQMVLTIKIKPRESSDDQIQPDKRQRTR
jgi:hypothetical protein